MIDFTLTPEQEALRSLAAEFAQKEVTPRAKEADETGVFPMDVAQKAWELGLIGYRIPKEYGGLGLGSIEDCLVAEELCSACMGIHATLNITNLAMEPILVAGSEDQKKKWLGPLTEKLMFAAYCVTEPAAGSDVAGIQTTARKKGNSYAVSGTKRFITGGSLASYYVVFAYTDKAQRHKGMTAFIIPRDSKGVTVGKKEPMMGQRASDTREITFEEVEVPAANRLGDEGQAFKIAMAAFDRTRPGVAAGAVGIARAALEHSTRYAKERKAFGQSIAEFQAIQFMLADMAMQTEAARLLTYKSAWLIDHGQRNSKLASMAKAFASDVAMKAAVDAVQILGGVGYSREYPVEKLMRDAKVTQIYEGTSQIQRLVIARHVIQEIG
ncbi:MAG: acyl-CoA dehydrogenase family protein [Nitrospirae bacterium]|nr:acyl-CoA dehydrogenase family protein [Nitrospirota bacterium]